MVRVGGPSYAACIQYQTKKYIKNGGDLDPPLDRGQVSAAGIFTLGFCRRDSFVEIASLCSGGPRAGLEESGSLARRHDKTCCRLTADQGNRSWRTRLHHRLTFGRNAIHVECFFNSSSASAASSRYGRENPRSLLELFCLHRL